MRSTTLKTAVVAPMPSASVMMTVMVNARLRDTEYHPNSGTTLQPPSTYVWLHCGDWPRRLLIVVCSVQTWLLGFAG
ncbi:MAG TPA: hypothetical protein VND90_14665 [Terracidiphilus sp.]|nr:hypothetical protein [Terracidiphilus sp.]